MRIYLAARYSRRQELCVYRDQIHVDTDHKVQAVWLGGAHQISDRGVPIGDQGEALVEGDCGSDEEWAAVRRKKFAQEDLADVRACDLLIAFTEEPRSGHSRGGRHVEMGLAMGLGKRIWVIGPYENLFCWLHRRFDYFGDALTVLCQGVN